MKMATLNQQDQALASLFIDWEKFNTFYNPAAIDQPEASYRLELAIGQYLEDLKEAITDYAEFGGTIDGISEVIRKFNREMDDYAGQFGIEGLIEKDNFVKMMGHLVTR